MKAFKTFQNLDRSLWIITGLALICGVGVLDYLTGYELSLSLFYLIPIAMLTWATDGKTGIIMAFISAGVWLIADVSSGARYSSPIIYFWQAIIRVCYFLLMVFLIKIGKALEFEKAAARTDYLTGAANSRFFSEMIQMEIERSIRYHRPFTVVFLDVDDFKSINDNFGHSAGDMVLATAARTMRRHLRKTDIIARVGGDEFSILLSETDANTAQASMSRMQRGLLGEMQANRWAVTFSIGVVTFISPPESADEAINMADKIMYSVKNSGKNNIRYILYS